MWAVLESWEPVVANNSIDLGLSFSRDLGMEGHGQKEGVYRGYSLADGDQRLGMLPFWMELTVSAPPKLNKSVRVGSKAIIAANTT